jgi:hypothetical protein
LSRLEALKHDWEIHLEATAQQKTETCARFDSWEDLDESVKTFMLPSRDSQDLSEEPSTSESILPEDVLLTVLTFVGAPGRCASSAARSQCDKSLRDGLLLPDFPVKLCIKQHYQFGSEHAATSTWSLQVPTASGEGVMDIRTEASSELESCSTHQSKHSKEQVLDVWQAVKQFRENVGVHHKEGGNVQVEITLSDAAGRTLLDHKYQRRRFNKKADELLQFLSDCDTIPMPSLREDSLGEREPARPRRSGQRASGRPRSRPP